MSDQELVLTDAEGRRVRFCKRKFEVHTDLDGVPVLCSMLPGEPENEPSKRYFSAWVLKEATLTHEEALEAEKPAQRSDEPEHVIAFKNGRLDGIRMQTPAFPEKLILQLANGRTFRYENDKIHEELNGIVEYSFVMSRHNGDFDKELRQEEDSKRPSGGYTDV